MFQLNNVCLSHSGIYYTSETNIITLWIWICKLSSWQKLFMYIDIICIIKILLEDPNHRPKSINPQIGVSFFENEYFKLLFAIKITHFDIIIRKKKAKKISFRLLLLSCYYPASQVWSSQFIFFPSFLGLVFLSITDDLAEEPYGVRQVSTQCFPYLQSWHIFLVFRHWL